MKSAFESVLALDNLTMARIQGVTARLHEDLANKRFPVVFEINTQHMAEMKEEYNALFLNCTIETEDDMRTWCERLRVCYARLSFGELVELYAQDTNDELASLFYFFSSMTKVDKEYYGVTFQIMGVPAFLVNTIKNEKL